MNTKKWTGLFLVVFFCFVLLTSAAAETVFASESEQEVLKEKAIETIDNLLRMLKDEEKKEDTKTVISKNQETDRNVKQKKEFKIIKFSSGEVNSGMFAQSNQKDIKFTLGAKLSFELFSFGRNFHFLFDSEFKGFYAEDLTMKQLSYTTAPRIRIDFWEDSARIYAVFSRRNDYFFSTTLTDIVKKAEAGFMFNPVFIPDGRNSGFRYLGQKYYSVYFEKYFPQGRIWYRYGGGWRGGSRIFKWKKAVFYSEVNGKIIAAKKYNKRRLLLNYGLEIGLKIMRDEPFDIFVSAGTEEDAFGWMSGRHNFVMAGTRYKF